VKIKFIHARACRARLSFHDLHRITSISLFLTAR